MTLARETRPRQKPQPAKPPWITVGRSPRERRVAPSYYVELIVVARSVVPPDKSAASERRLVHRARVDARFQSTPIEDHGSYVIAPPPEFKGDKSDAVDAMAIEAVASERGQALVQAGVVALVNGPRRSHVELMSSCRGGRAEADEGNHDKRAPAVHGTTVRRSEDG